MFHDVKYTSLDVKRTSLDVKYTFRVVKHKFSGASATFSPGQEELFSQAAKTLFAGSRSDFREQRGFFPRVAGAISAGSGGFIPQAAATGEQAAGNISQE